MTYDLDKKIWTSEDFEKMGWHDCHIYKIRVSHDLELDIDYIFQWNKSELEGFPFTFWVAPATLVFKGIKDLEFEIDTAFNESVEIEDIEREITEKGIFWSIITRQGDLEFSSQSYQQFIRQDPFYQFGQTISYQDRGGFSLEQTTSQENPNRKKEEYLSNRKNDLEHFENAKKRHLKRIEKEALKKSKDNIEISTKDYLLKKKSIKEMLDYYDYWLKGTKFENW